MFPILEIGPLAIQAAGFFLLISLAIGTWLTGKFSEALGTNTDAIENGVLIILGVFLASARLGFILQNPQTFLGNPSEIISLSPRTLNIGFGILVSTLTAASLTQRNHIPLWPTLDTLTPLIILITIGIHLANLANGDGFGLKTQLPWGLDLWGAKRHPVQFYALILLGLYFIVHLLFTKRLSQTGFLRSGLLFSITAMAIAIIIILTRAFVAEKILIGNVDVGQLAGFFVLIGSLIIIYRIQYQGDKETEVILGVGSNINPHANLTKGYETLATDFKIVGSSSIYLTQAVKSQPDAQDYMNQTIALRAAMAFPDLYKHLKTIEKAFGREPGNKKVVPLDLDILTYGDQVFNFQGKQIPDPDLGKYRYIAEPLGEMSPNFRHPATGISIERILDKIEDEAKISKINEVDDGIKR